jgi:hypothetical protein
MPNAPTPAEESADAKPAKEAKAPAESEAKGETPPAEDDELAKLKKALDSERRLRREAAGRLEELEPIAKQAKDDEDARKSETQRLTEALAAEKASREAAELRALKTDVATDKGLPPKLAKFLVGTTREELEEAADVLLAEMKQPDAPASTPAKSGKPQPRLTNNDSSADADVGLSPLELANKYLS